MVTRAKLTRLEAAVAARTCPRCGRVPGPVGGLDRPWDELQAVGRGLPVVERAELANILQAVRGCRCPGCLRVLPAAVVAAVPRELVERAEALIARAEVLPCPPARN